MISEWNSSLQQQVDRPATQEELSELDGMPSRSFAAQRTEYLISVREMRDKALARLNGYGSTLLLAEPPELVEEKAACLYLINGLLDITTIPSVVEAVTMVDLKAAVKAEYARLVAYANDVSPNLVKTFRQVDA